MRASSHPGIYKRHSRSCASRAGGECNCVGTWEAWVLDSRDGRKIRRTFPTLAAAQVWRDAAQAEKNAEKEQKRLEKEMRQRMTMAIGGPIESRDGIVTDCGSRESFDAQLGGRPVPRGATLNEWAAQWVDGMRSGAIRQRNGMAYRRSAVETYALHLLGSGRPIPEYLGDYPVNRITQTMLQVLVDFAAHQGAKRKAIEGMITPLRVIFRQARHAGEVRVDPTSGLFLPD